MFDIFAGFQPVERSHPSVLHSDGRHRRKEVQIQRRTGFRECNLQTYKLTNLQTYKLTNLQTYKLTNLQTYKLTNLQVTNLQTCKLTS
jgi:hypothetical protein